MKKTVIVSAIDHVTSSWGDAAPAWIVELAQECDKTSQATVAKRLGRSASLINQLLKCKYPGDLTDVEGRFRSAFNPEKTQCPVMGMISGEDCLTNQAKPYQPSNHISVRLFRACAKCQHNLKGKKDVK